MHKSQLSLHLYSWAKQAIISSPGQSDSSLNRKWKIIKYSLLYKIVFFLGYQSLSAWVLHLMKRMMSLLQSLGGSNNILLKMMTKYYFSAPLLLPWRRAHLRRHSTFLTVRQIIFWVKDSASQKYQILKSVSTLRRRRLLSSLDSDWMPNQAISFSLFNLKRIHTLLSNWVNSKGCGWQPQVEWVDLKLVSACL